MPFTDTTTCRAVAAALLATAALALTTACHEISGNRMGNPAGVSPAPTSSSREDGENLSPGPDGRVACTPEMLRFHAGAMPRRTHRMLLTVTNSSGRTCHFAAQRYPLLRFGDDRQPILPAIAASRPSTAVSLAPGDTAYATITTSAAGGTGGRGHRGRKISQFGVALTGRATPTQVGLDGRAPVHVDPRTATVTYWQPSLEAARKW
ncbi:DUF4232 domain-containing protein [Streptomyces decoyicus]|uniref:DUF4232 domain-containing protein n=1 Tax=Streptomyces decoyicus TaxID=249567 RepID=UPI0004AA373D|nr:DUF4232 domain-containing protein [Streptomyces decoyicus]KOG37297.1 hypothetical protein ADK74_37170 [Streptomyces decoyicus]QZY17258.1 DUF4232 domain-containing protein [Streptomyces decoyicus]